MISIKTKKEIRQELADDMTRFLNQGGEIKRVKQGESGREPGANFNREILLSVEKKDRTPLTQEINALDERKKKLSQKKQQTAPRPAKKIIYDDFGEPVREVWE